MDQQENNLAEWTESEVPATTLAQMDTMIATLSQKRAEHKAAKAEADRILAEVEEAEKLVISALKSNGKTKYELEGVGLVYISFRDSFTTPKTNEQKIALFNYIKSKHGPDVLMGLTSINSMTLNSWAKKEIESDPTLQIPGLESPTSTEILNFRKKD